jgi:hypothetical protein
MKKYDLEKLWAERTKYEFATPDVEATLATMVEDIRQDSFARD